MSSTAVTGPDDTGLSRSLVYLVSTRGGDNYWARIINGCVKFYTPGEGTLAISTNGNGRYVLHCNPTLFDSWSAPLRKLAVIHEAAHVALRHVERLMRILHDTTDDIVKAAVIAVFNYAADFTANDQIVRLEPEFKNVHRTRKDDEAWHKAKALAKKQNLPMPPAPSGEWCFLLPEEFGFPVGLSMEEYIRLLLKDLEKFAKQVTKQWRQNAIQDLKEIKDPAEREQKRKELEEKLEEKIDPAECEPDAESSNEEGADGESDETQPGDGDQSGESEGGGSLNSQGKPSQKSGKGKGRGQSSQSGDGQQGSGEGESDEMSNLAETLHGMSHDDPGLFKRLLEAFHDLTARNHKDWNEKAQAKTGQDAISEANKLKRHARSLVKTAHEQTARSRGTVPAYIEKIVKGLLEEPPTPWDLIFEDVVASSIASKIIEEIAMPNPNLINEFMIEPWPGHSLENCFNILWVRDTSGSMGDIEHLRGCMRFNNLLEQNRQVNVTLIDCDAAIQFVKMNVTNVMPPSPEELEELQTRHGGGGTVYSPVFRYIQGRDLPSDWISPETKPEQPLPKPDLIIWTTDGGVILNGECFPEYRPSCPIVWLLMPGCSAPPGMENTAPDRVISMFHIKPEFDE
jgi:predicted metal-dependent peptidase